MKATPRVLLVTMPWASVQRGSIQLALLGACLRQRRIPCAELHANLVLAEELGLEPYEMIADQSYLLGEIVMAERVYDGADAASALDRISEHLAWETGFFAARVADQVRAGLPALRAGISRMFDRLLAEVPWADHDVVGLTTTFAQNLASIALARLLKARHPRLVVVLGGANCDSEMGPALARTFPEIDHVVSGEGEEALAELVEALRDGRPLQEVAGITFRDGGQVHVTPRRPQDVDLNRAPVPDYSAYLEALGRSPLGAQIKPILGVEWSRGCWWGVKHLCTFCGLNQDRLNYRTKSARRVVKEVLTLARRHERLNFEVTDNILDYHHFDDLLPALARLRQRYDLKFAVELKANLRKDQVALLDEAGVRAAQPGIESLSDHVLQLMDKGTTGLRNIQSIKWLNEFGIYPRYGFLFDIPGESEADYERMIDWIPALKCLPPPGYVIPFALHRFSPYFVAPERHGIHGVRPALQYELAYPDSRVPLREIAYLFEFNRSRSSELDALHRRLQNACEHWRREYRPGLLVYRRGPGFVLVRDARGAAPEMIRLQGPDAALFLACDRVRQEDALAEELGVGHAEALDRLQGLIRRQLVLRDGSGRVLGLAQSVFRPRVRAAVSRDIGSAAADETPSRSLALPVIG